MEAIGVGAGVGAGANLSVAGFATSVGNSVAMQAVGTVAGKAMRNLAINTKLGRVVPFETLQKKFKALNDATGGMLPTTSGHATVADIA